MIAFSHDGFWSGGMMLVFWGLSEHSWPRTATGAAMIAISFWRPFFEQFDRKRTAVE
jgi:hypothetical protein